MRRNKWDRRMDFFYTAPVVADSGPYCFMATKDGINITQHCQLINLWCATLVDLCHASSLAEHVDVKTGIIRA